MSRRVHHHYVPEPVGPPDLFSDGSGVKFPGGVAKSMALTVGPISPPSQPVDTSLGAAARVQGHTARIREAIYLYLKAVGGATAGEISTQCGLNPSTVRPRLRELEGSAPWAKGKLPARIVRTPERRKGMRVYVAI